MLQEEGFWRFRGVRGVQAHGTNLGCRGQQLEAKARIEAHRSEGVPYSRICLSSSDGVLPFFRPRTRAAQARATRRTGLRDTTRSVHGSKRRRRWVPRVAAAVAVAEATRRRARVKRRRARASDYPGIEPRTQGSRYVHVPLLPRRNKQ